MRKLIILPGANSEACEIMAQHLSKLPDDGTIIMTHDIKIYNIDDAKLLTVKQVRRFCKDMGIKIE